MKQFDRFFVVLLGLALLPSCRVGKWVDKTFPQAKPLLQEHSKMSPYIKSIFLYECFSTKVNFDVVWLSDKVRTIYSDIFARKQGKNKEAKNAFLRRQLEENDHYISFYVLSLRANVLGRSKAQWSVHLDVDGKNLTYSFSHLNHLAAFLFCTNSNRFSGGQVLL